jgi:hypothetical protein
MRLAGSGIFIVSNYKVLQPQNFNIEKNDVPRDKENENNKKFWEELIRLLSLHESFI